MIVERPALERRVLDALDAGRIPVVLGGCASGRTSLLLRLQQTLGSARAQYIDLGGAASTPERCLAMVTACTTLARPGALPAGVSTPRAAFDAFLSYCDRSAGPDGRPATFLFDEFLDLRTFENFPGLRQVVRDFLGRMGASPAGIVLASRFTARAHRLLRDAPSRFEVVHIPPMTAADVRALAVRVDRGRTDVAVSQAAAIAALAAGRAGYVSLLIDGLTAAAPSADVVAAFGALLAPDGRLTARCRESYDFRVHRARGFGALRAILGILAEDEPLNLTEIAHRLQRTPGSTKDYLSWLEDVDLVTMTGKRYAFDDPVVRLYVRLYARSAPPSDLDIVREVHAYAQERLPRPLPLTVSPAGRPPAGERVADLDRASGIIEID